MFKNNFQKNSALLGLQPDNSKTVFYMMKYISGVYVFIPIYL